MNARPKFDWSQVQSSLPGFAPPSRRAILLARLDYALTAVAAHFVRRKLARENDRAIRGSPLWYDNRLREDIGLPRVEERARFSWWP